MKACMNDHSVNVYSKKIVCLSRSVVLAVSMLAAAQNAQASCALDQTQAAAQYHPETLYLDLSDLQLNADAAVGEVIARKAVNIRQVLSTNGCSAADLLHSQLQSTLNLVGGSTLGPDIYATVTFHIDYP